VTRSCTRERKAAHSHTGPEFDLPANTLIIPKFGGRYTISRVLLINYGSSLLEGYKKMRIFRVRLSMNYPHNSIREFINLGKHLITC
jgi:hypothetical protein